MIELGENFTKRFEKYPDNELGWISDPFLVDTVNSNFPLNIKKELLIYFSRNKKLCIQFILSIGNEYADLKKKAINFESDLKSIYI